MGSMIHLAVGDFEVDWGKNDHFTMHGCLFQRGDLARTINKYVGNNGKVITEMKEGAVRPLSKVVGRLELMGYTLRTANELFTSLASEANVASYVSFEVVAEALRRVDIDQAAAIYHEDYSFESYFDKIADRSQIPPPVYDDVLPNGADKYKERLFRTLPQAEADILIFFEVMESLPPYTVLRLLAENPETATRDISWVFADVVETGWVNRDHVVADLGKVQRFLVVTEGSSDSKVIEHAFKMLRPDVADFFHFVDMEEGYPFTGAGNLHRFCQGLVSIGIENNVVVVYDNDAIGVAGFEKTSELRLPTNMRVIRLPDCDSLRQFDTTGPNGESKADINGCAAAIECYLDLGWKRPERPVVRWTSYENRTRSYQGELPNKGLYARQFLGLKRRDSEYDFSKIEGVLESVLSASIKIAEDIFPRQESLYSHLV